MTFQIRPEYSDLPWSYGVSPQEGDPECRCTLCGFVIGVAEEDPRWDDHPEHCGDCPVCEIAIRVWCKTDIGTGEWRFHDACFLVITGGKI